MKRPTLGQWCTLTGFAMKNMEVAYTKDGRFDHAITTFERVPRATPVEGMYIGFRTWSVGRTDMEYEYGAYGTQLSSWKQYRAKEYREVWLFVTSERSTPISVFPEDVELVEGGE